MEKGKGDVERTRGMEKGKGEGERRMRKEKGNGREEEDEWTEIMKWRKEKGRDKGV